MTSNLANLRAEHLVRVENAHDSALFGRQFAASNSEL